MSRITWLEKKEIVVWLVFNMLLYSQSDVQQNLHFFPLESTYLEIVAGSALLFPKCHLKQTTPGANLTKFDIFWMKDDVFRINSTEDPVLLENNEFLFPTFQIYRSILSDFGVYKCAVQIVNQMEQPAFSDKFEVKIKPQVVEFLSKIDLQNSIYPLTLHNCKYRAQEDLSHFSYWLLNGNVKYKVQNRFERSTNEGTLNQYEVPPLGIESYDMIGSYQCVIFDNNTMDKEFMSEIFVIPTLPEPEFVKTPFSRKNVDGSVEACNSINIFGCEFDSYFKLKEEEVYWIKDGVRKINAYVDLVNEQFPIRYRFSNLYFNRISYIDHGFYQCAINSVVSPPKEIIISQYDLQMQNTSNTKLSIKLNSPWKLDYSNQSSEAFNHLKNVVLKNIKQVTFAIINDITDYIPMVIVTITELSPESGNVVSRITIADVHGSLKLKLSNAMLQYINKDSFKQINAESVELKSLDYCPKSVFGDVNYKGEYTFEQTPADQIAEQMCIYQGNGVVQIECIGNLKDGPTWGVPDFSRCEPKTETTKKLIQLSKETICDQSSQASCSLTSISKNLRDTVANSSVITNYHDVNLIATILEKVASADHDISEEVFTDVLQSIDILMESDAKFIAKSQIETSSSSIILNALTKFAELFSKQIESSVSISKKNIAFHVEKVEKGPLILLAQQLSNNSVEISFSNVTDFNKTGVTYAAIQIPSEVFSDESELLYSYFFRYDSFFLSEKNLLKLVGRKVSNRQIVQSAIFSASFYNKNVTNLVYPVILTFKKIQSEFSGSSSCNYWDEKLETGIQNVFGGWLKTGCYKYEAGVNTDELFTCACDHLTNFALLLDVNQASDNPLGLQIITFIGCGISLVGLSFTLLTLAVFRNLRQKLPQKILICLCFSLMGLLLTFLIGAVKTSPRLGCQLVAAMLHFFILSTFSWMLVEAFNLYRSFVKVFKKVSDTDVFRNANILAWGFPAVIVIISGISKPDELGNEKVCVVRGNPFYFAVLLPVCLILVVNFVVLVVTMLSLTKRVKFGKDVGNKQHNLSQARITFMCATLLGLSWVFAVLAVKDLSTVFQWLFCITTSLQGFFIFVFHILRNKDAMNEWRRCFVNNQEYKLASSSQTAKTYEMRPITGGKNN